MNVASPYTAVIPEQAPIVTQRGAEHDITPTGRPSWYGRELGVEDRSAFSRTGDVALLAGNTFGVHYATAGAALTRAQEASRDGQGAVLVLAAQPSAAIDATVTGATPSAVAARTEFFLARAYNVEFRNGEGYVIERSHVADRSVKNYHAEVRYLVEGDKIVTAAH